MRVPVPHPTTFALALLACSHVPAVQGLLQSSTSQQCYGTFYDQSRLEKLTAESIAGLMSNNFSPNGVIFNFATRQVNRVAPADDQSSCLAERHRVRELIQGVPIFGADFVVTVNACSEEANQDELIRANPNTLSTFSPEMVRSADGYMVSSVDVPTGYAAKRSAQEAVAMVAAKYEVEQEKVTTMALEIYPTIQQDYRAWIGTVLVDTTPGDPHLYQVVIDDESEEVILQCEMAGLYEKQEKMESMVRRRAQETAEDDGEPLDSRLCTSCATNGDGITWGDGTEHVECDAQTLYMSNEGRKTLCVAGVDASGNNYTGPGPVPALHYNGTLNCGSLQYCALSPMPSCQDAIADVHWGAINFLQYMQDHLGIMGGLVKDANNPLPVMSRVHYDYRYCNAFYVPGTYTVTFGDCDCEIFTPLVSTDVVIHEIVHGMTSESSNLIYFMESGGLNEAYSDIMACALEHSINDSTDSPDFTVGESLGKKFLRHMEFPAEDGKSIDSYCKMEIGMNVHYSSGYLNKAYVNAVRKCEASGCATRSECAQLLADTFMYTNMETLASASNFKDAGEQTCRDVADYFVARSPSTQCTSDQVKDAVVTGFDSVGVTMSAADCNAEITCEPMCFFDATFAAGRNILKLGQMICNNIFGKEGVGRLFNW